MKNRILVGTGANTYPHDTNDKTARKRGDFLAVACFLQNHSLQYHPTATKTILQNIRFVSQHLFGLMTKSSNQTKENFVSFVLFLESSVEDIDSQMKML